MLQISPFKTTKPSQSENLLKFILSGQQNLPKVMRIWSWSFEDSPTVPNWQCFKMIPLKTATFSQSENVTQLNCVFSFCTISYISNFMVHEVSLHFLSFMFVLYISCLHIIMCTYDYISCIGLLLCFISVISCFVTCSQSVVCWLCWDMLLTDLMLT